MIGSAQMIKSSLVTLLWLLCGVLAHAEIPKAEISVVSLNSGFWPAEYTLTLTVPQEHHAYLDKGDENIYIPIALDPKKKLAAAQLTLDNSKKPTGSYDSTVKATVLRGQGDFVIALAPIGNVLLSNETILEISYQLCNDITAVCFRPQIAQVNLSLPSLSANTLQQASLSVAPEATSMTDQLLLFFQDNQENTLIMFGLMLLAGILSVATPCVYPMLPITSLFIANRADGTANKVRLHAGVYLIGIIVSYMFLGLMAGMTGGAFNSFMQSAWVNIGFALFFAFFAISLLGFYELTFMQNEVHTLDQRSSKVKGLPGTWLMGVVAGLVISPCVGPIVFALLLKVADQIADKTDLLSASGQALTYWDKFVISFQGSIMMGGFGLGVGLPFFIISVVKFKKLPKAGYWMNKIKYGFGLMILYFSYVYFIKGMGVLGVEPKATLLLALGVLAVWIAVINCNVLSQLSIDAQPNQKMHHFIGVIAIITGIWLVVAGLNQTPIVTTTQALGGFVQDHQNNTVSSVIQEESGISWYRSFDIAQKSAQQSGKPIFIDFYASWCANCVAFKAETATNALLNRVLRENTIAIKLVDKEPEFEKFRENPDHRQLKIGLPYFAIISPNGKLLWSGTDYKATDKIINILSSANSFF